jgi:hypothetical protein
LYSPLCSYLGITRKDIIAIGHCAKTRKLLVEVQEEESIHKLKVDFDKIITINFGSLDVKGIIPFEIIVAPI